MSAFIIASHFALALAEMLLARVERNHAILNHARHGDLGSLTLALQTDIDVNYTGAFKVRLLRYLALNSTQSLVLQETALSLAAEFGHEVRTCIVLHRLTGYSHFTLFDEYRPVLSS